MDATPVIAANGTVLFVFRGGEVVGCDHDRTYEWGLHVYPCGLASPAIADSGTIYLPTAMTHRLVAIRGSSPLARTPWPKFRGNSRNTGNLNDAPR